MDTIVVGDIHGDISLVKRVLSYPCNIIFVGDFLDSYTNSVEDQVDSLRLVLSACASEGGRVQALMGNHEVSYTHPYMRCSGFNLTTYQHVIHLKGLMERYLKPYIRHKGFFISHAGISQKLLDCESLSQKEYLEKGDFYQIGRSRGGYAACGGLFWCDWWQEFEPVEGLKQIVGHSNYRPSGQPEGIVTKGQGDCISYNIDCLTRVSEVLLLDKDGNVSFKEI
jgi:hypothetical protein